MMFQSTPVIANGRIAGTSKQAAVDRKFQSTPVIANGRIQVRGVAIGGDGKVSIHARYC